MAQRYSLVRSHPFVLDRIILNFYTLNIHIASHFPSIFCQLIYKLLESNSLKITELSKQIEEIQSQIQKVDSEKMKFIQEIDIANRSKAQIGSRIANIVYESERMKAMIKESEQRCLQIEKRIFQSILKNKR